MNTFNENHSIHFLYTRAYMGNDVYNANGKKLTWQKLRDMKDINVDVKIEVHESRNQYTILKPTQNKSL